MKRTFYKSTDGSCKNTLIVHDGMSGFDSIDNRKNGIGFYFGGITNFIRQDEDDDSFILPIDACVGPFGPPRPWGKFSLIHKRKEVRDKADDTDITVSEE